jgi:hypothetical protein
MTTSPSYPARDPATSAEMSLAILDAGMPDAQTLRDERDAYRELLLMALAQWHALIATHAAMTRQRDALLDAQRKARR